MTHEIATALFLGMAIQAFWNGVVNRGKPVHIVAWAKMTRK